MEKKEYLNEETYEKGKKKILSIALIILIVGLLIGGGLISLGLIKQQDINKKYSDEAKTEKIKKLEEEKQNISNQVSIEKISLDATKKNLENKIAPIETQKTTLENEQRTEFMKNGFSNKYNELDVKIKELNKTLTAERKKLTVVQNVLDDSDFYCKFDGEHDVNTSKYCYLVIQLNKKNLEISSIDDEFSDFNKSMDSSKNIPFYMFGAFIIIASAMTSGTVYMFAKRREILAFSAQQVMPVAQEGIEKMAPTIGKAGASIAKEMAPVYGNIAKEISKGIKDGLNNEEK